MEEERNGTEREWLLLKCRNVICLGFPILGASDVFSRH